MKKEKYVFHEDLKIYAHMNIPVIPRVVPMMQKLMEVLYLKERSDRKVKVSVRKVISREGHSTRVLLYEPVKGKKNAPCILFFHGGGFVYQAAPHHFYLARKLSAELGYKTFLADYRLAPAHKFPAAPEDCFLVYRWLLAKAKELEIDPARIAVCGDSAGGNLAAVLCLMAKDHGVQMPAAQMLLYPFVDRRLVTESMQRYTDTPMCNRKDMDKYIRMYVGDLENTNISYLSPAEAECVQELPEAYIEVAQYDCLRDEGIAYGEKLQKDGVQVELHEVKGAMHGYDIAKNTPLMKKYMGRRVRFLKKLESEL